MNKFVLTLGTAAAVLCAVSASVSANDARSIAMGGAVIANGEGAHGALSNPASMMQMHRRGETTHIRMGISSEVRADSELVDTLSDEENETIFEDLEDEIDNLDGQAITCNPVTADDDTVCIADTDPVSVLSDRILNILNVLDGETIDAQANIDLGVAFTSSDIAYGVNLGFRGTVSAIPDVADGDRVYIGQFVDLLGDDLTFGEITQDTQPDYITFDETTGIVDVVLPDENDPVTGEPVLNSGGQVATLLRAQLAISFARTLSIAGYEVDVGVTPKISSIEASDVDSSVQDEFDDNSQSVDDQYNANEVSESSFTMDIGMSTELPTFPIRVAAVIRNLVPESTTTNNGFEFETTPQLIVGAGWRSGKLSASADLALNSAKVDNFETQKIGIGVEYGTRLFAIRGGINHDAGRSDSATALTFGFGLAALQVGARITDTESSEASVQLSFTF